MFPRHYRIVVLTLVASLCVLLVLVCTKWGQWRQWVRNFRAERMYSAAARRAPTNADAWVQLAAFQLANEHYTSAAHSADRAIVLRPEDYTAWLISGLANVALAGRYPGDGLLKLKVRSAAEKLHALGSSLEGKGKLADAMQALLGCYDLAYACEDTRIGMGAYRDAVRLARKLISSKAADESALGLQSLECLQNLNLDWLGPEGKAQTGSS